MQSTSLAGRFVRRVLIEGSAASVLSALALGWRGKQETGSAAAPLNAPSHWVWGREALWRDRVDGRHTALGTLIHHGSSLLWAAVFEGLQRRRRRPTALSVAGDAAAVTALAAFVDLKLTPERFTPGFERRLSPRSLVLVYASFGLGLASAGWWAMRRRR